MSLVWIQRVTYLICIALCYVLLILEIRSYSMFNPKNKFEIWLRRICIMVYLICGFRIIALTLYTFPHLCVYMNPKYSLGPGNVHVLITIYQITRLYYCFQAQINISKFQKSILIFYYVNGALLILYTISFRIIFFRVIDLDLNGCNLYRTNGWKVYMIIGTFWHYSWSFSVVFYYIHKVKQLQKNSVINNWNNAMEFSKVNINLRKILILTVGIEISGLSSIILSIVTATNNIEFLYLNASVQHVLVAFMMYLMMEHNFETYIKLMHILTSKRCIFCNCCCCSICKSFIYSSLPSEPNNGSCKDPEVGLSRHIQSGTSKGELNSRVTNNSVNVHSKRTDTTTQSDQ